MRKGEIFILRTHFFPFPRNLCALTGGVAVFSQNTESSLSVISRPSDGETSHPRPKRLPCPCRILRSFPSLHAGFLPLFSQQVEDCACPIHRLRHPGDSTHAMWQCAGHVVRPGQGRWRPPPTVSDPEGEKGGSVAAQPPRPPSTRLSRVICPRQKNLEQCLNFFDPFFRVPQDPPPKAGL